MELDDWRLEIEGEIGGMGLHPTAASGCVGVAPRRQGHAPSVTPPGPPLPWLLASGRAAVAVWGKTTLWQVCG